MLAGEEVHLLVVADGYGPEFRVFASQSDAVEAWHEALEDALQYDEDTESLDSLPAYDRGRYFLAGNGMSAQVLAIEVE